MKNLISTNTAAELIGVAPYTLKYSRCTGLLLGLKAPEYIKMGRSVRYDADTVDAWIAQFNPQSNTGE